MTTTFSRKRGTDTRRPAAVRFRRPGVYAGVGCLVTVVFQGAFMSRGMAVGPTTPTSKSAPTADPVPAAGEPSSDEHPTQPPPGQLSSKFPIDYWDPENSVPSNKDRNSNPLEFGYFLQDLLEKAEQARHNNDFQAVVRFYRAVAKAVPENAKGWSKLCEAYEIVKDRERAIRACRYALDRPAVEFQDYVRYANLVLAKDGALAAAELSDLNAVLAHLEKQGLALPVGQLRCELALKQNDIPLLESCTKTLSRLAPDDPRTVVFGWSLAVKKGQRAEAERLVERAIKAGVLLERVERMRSITASSAGLGRRTVWIFSATALLLLILAVVLVGIRRRTVTHRLAR